MASKCPLSYTPSCAPDARPLEWRVKQLQALRRMLQENEPAIVEAMRKDLHRPSRETTLTEVIDGVAHCHYYERNLKRLTKAETIPTPFNAKPMVFKVGRSVTSGRVVCFS